MCFSTRTGFSMQVRDFGFRKIRTPKNGSSGGAGAPGRVRHTLAGLVDVGEGVGETRRRPARNLGEKERALFEARDRFT